MNRAEIMKHAERFVAYRREKALKAARGKLHPFRDEMLTVAQIAERTGLAPCTITRRIKAGLPLHHPDKRTLTDDERIRRGLGPRYPETGW